MFALLFVIESFKAVVSSMQDSVRRLLVAAGINLQESVGVRPIRPLTIQPQIQLLFHPKVQVLAPVHRPRRSRLLRQLARYVICDLIYHYWIRILYFNYSYVKNMILRLRLQPTSSPSTQPTTSVRKRSISHYLCSYHFPHSC